MTTHPYLRSCNNDYETYSLVKSFDIIVCMTEYCKGERLLFEIVSHTC